MKTTTVKLKDLVPMENNIRIHNYKQIEELIKSIKLFGQIRPIVIDDKNTVLAGHGLLEALIQMGYEEGQALVMKGLKESDKKKLMLADNKIYELGNTNYDAMLAVLAEINLEGESLDIPGYDIEVLESLLADTDDIDEELKKYGDISDERKEELKEEREELKATVVQPDEREIVLNNDMIKVEQKKETERPKPYIECPKCSEKIWL